MKNLTPTDLRVWRVEISGKRVTNRSGYRVNRSYAVAAPNLRAALNGAQLLINADEIEDYWVVSVNHVGPVHGVVQDAEEPTDV